MPSDPDFVLQKFISRIGTPSAKKQKKALSVIVTPTKASRIRRVRSLADGDLESLEDSDEDVTGKFKYYSFFIPLFDNRYCLFSEIQLSASEQSLADSSPCKPSSATGKLIYSCIIP